MSNLTNQRTFLGAAAVLAAARGLPSMAARTAPGEVRLGVATY